MKKDRDTSTPPETEVKSPVSSVIAGKEFKLSLNDNAALAAILVAGATTVCCVCGGADAAVRLGIAIVDKLIK